jgi:hypothetical protein
MTYKINNTELSLQPSRGRWIPRQAVGIDGSGHPVYPGVRQFELVWELTDITDFNQLQVFFNTVISTGTAVASLPKYGASTYVFYDYSGCTLGEPEMGEYFTEHHTRVKLLIANIST